jgi:5-methylthioribose kinase
VDLARVSFQSGFCDVDQSGDHPENNLAKFGYILFRKQGKQKKKKKNTESFSIFGYLLEVIVEIWRYLEFSFFKIWAIFSHEKSFV